LAQEGARVIISSRKEANVKKALEQAKCEDLDIMGLVCHIGKSEDRKKLYDKVR
jgi:dehydrogenase/reductase SDR family protein 4